MLQFRLVHVPRDNAPPYTAVSYAWGNEAPSEIIKMDGQIFRVRPNAWSCLYYLGIASRHADWNYLWVDAICIDQGNDNERNAQVSYMDQTYGNATCVSVWLGLVPIPDEQRPLTSFRSPCKTIEADAFDWFDAMDDLANRNYWSRYWVVQEFLLGKSVQLHCSNTSMDWVDFQEILCRKAGIMQFGNEHTAILPDQMATLYAAMPLTLGRHPDKHPEFLQPLAALLVTHGRSECSDPRDRVFALLGLVESDERRLLSRFFPDYTMHMDVVRIVTLAHLMQYGYLTDPKLRNITPKSDGIFRGLGVPSKSLAQRRRLIDQAKRMDYLDTWEPGALSLALGSSILEFPVRTEDEVVDETLEGIMGMGTMWTDEMRTRETPTSWGHDGRAESAWADESHSGGKCCSKMLKVVFFLVLGAVSYYYAMWKRYAST